MTSRHFATWTYVKTSNLVLSYFYRKQCSFKKHQWILACSVSFLFLFLKNKRYRYQKRKEKKRKNLFHLIFSNICQIYFPFFFSFALNKQVPFFRENKWLFDYCIIRSTNPQFILISCIIPIRAYRWLLMITAHFLCSYLSIQSH